MSNLESGLLPGVPFLDSPHCDNRPRDCDVDLLVIHAISLPPGEYGTSDIVDFFMGSLDVQKDPYYKEIIELKVSAHFLIDREGLISQFVSLKKRAWHAGVSSFKGRSKVNDYSIGIELVGDVNSSFSKQQYIALVGITKSLQQIYPEIKKDRIVGHSDIAPNRKYDPGPYFSWKKYTDMLENKH